MRGQHTARELSSILLAMQTEYVGHLDHHRSLIKWLIASNPTLSAVWVR
jgi:hypothetical protein